MKKIIAIALLLTISACATPYQEMAALGGVKATPEPNPGDEKDPWNWKLALAEGLIDFGVGLGQMSVGEAVNIGGVRD